MTKLARVLREVNECFKAAPLHYGHGTDNAWDEAVALVLGVSELADIEASLEVELDEACAASIRVLAERRIDERMPLAYLLGKTTYCGDTFHVRPGVVVPRSPLGPWLRDGLSTWLVDPPRRILDLCCGSGAIGIVAAKVFADSQVLLVDLDELAIETAIENVVHHGLNDRVDVLRSDLFGSLPVQAFDVILCNPPYVDASDMIARPPEYRHEPELGLAGGDIDGLGLVKRILTDAGDYLSEAGLLACEVGNSARHLVAEYPEAPFVWLDLPEGGEGVFLAERSLLCQLRECPVIPGTAH